MNTDDSIKQKILNTVLKHISETGKHQITIREIARLANVNSAAISYYFGSKDELIHQACKYYYDLGSKFFEELEISNCEPREKLKCFFINYTNHMFKFPGFLKVQMSQYINEDKTRPDVEEWIKGNLKLLANTIGKATGEEDHEILYCKAMQFLSNMAYPFLLNKYGYTIDILNFSNEILREKYINSMLNGII